MEEIKGMSVLIAGFGREGKSTRSWLAAHYPDISVHVTDRKDGDGYLRDPDRYDTVIRSPGVPPYTLRTSAYITTATNIFFSRAPGMTIGITGTKGKSTTASLIAHILKTRYADVRLCGNIGYPMLDALEHATPNTIFVIELSSHQLVDIRYSPQIAVLLDIVPEHLDYYPDIAAYTRAKENIFRFQKPEDHAVRFEKSTQRFETSLSGNDDNIAAAVRVARILSVPEEDIRSALKTFTPLPHRLEPVGEHDGVRYINDSLATTPEATVHALDALGDDVQTLIAGGYDRGLSYDVLGRRLAESNVSLLILFPDTGARIFSAYKNAHPKRIAPHYTVTSMEDAVRLAAQHTASGKICLLSPASASFNLFTDYAQRGNRFRVLVERFGQSTR